MSSGVEVRRPRFRTGFLPLIPYAIMRMLSVTSSAESDKYKHTCVADWIAVDK